MNHPNLSVFGPRVEVRMRESWSMIDLQWTMFMKKMVGPHERKQRLLYMAGMLENLAEKMRHEARKK